ncbi:MAG: NlpC/P60 family protein [Gammaproteobacteria bacterium]|nr:NlpC/P60 family protein [Gammaproteobacteria bacterium]
MTMIAHPDLHIRRTAFAVIGALCLAGCAGPTLVESQPGEVSAAKRISATVGERAAAIALQQVGSAYRYGGTSPAGFDCSGLVQYSYRAAGKTVPRTTGQLWNVAGEVAYDDLQAGDLLFFRFDGKMSHVGIYVGNEQFVHAPSAGGSVSVESMNAEHYRRGIIRAGRLR